MTHFRAQMGKSNGTHSGGCNSAAARDLGRVSRAASPLYLRNRVSWSRQTGPLQLRISPAVVAAIPHQGHRQGPGGLGSQVGRVLAERRKRSARPSALPDRGPQRADGGSEILRRQPRAGRKGDHPAVAVAGGLRSLVGGALLPRGQGGVGDGRNRSSTA